MASESQTTLTLLIKGLVAAPLLCAALYHVFRSIIYG